MNQQEQDQKHMEICAMGLLHALARAAGGTLTINIKDIPEQLPFSFRVSDGRAIFVALEKPKPTLVQPSGRMLNRLNGP